MAIISCKECNAEISNKSTACPKCGNPTVNYGVRPGFLRAFMWLLLPLFLLTICTGNDLIQSAERRANPPKPYAPSWSYRQSTDDMTSKPSYFASIKSQNTLNFGFPYSGEQRATLSLREHARHGKGVMLSIEKGQFVCASITNCTVLVRFDDKKPIKFSYSKPSDHSSDTIFINKYHTFYKKLKAAKTIKIQTEFYQEGNRTLKFDVLGFDAKKYLKR